MSCFIYSVRRNAFSVELNTETYLKDRSSNWNLSVISSYERRRTRTFNQWLKRTNPRLIFLSQEPTHFRQSFGRVAKKVSWMALFISSQLSGVQKTYLPAARCSHCIMISLSLRCKWKWRRNFIRHLQLSLCRKFPCCSYPCMQNFEKATTKKSFCIIFLPWASFNIQYWENDFYFDRWQKRSCA